MEALLLGIYAFFVWLIFIKFKWLPWNTTSQVTVVIIPIVALTALILTLNVVAPSSADVRVIKYVVQVIPQVRGRVIEVPVEPNRLVKKGELLFRIDPTPYQNDLNVAKARLAADEAKLAQAAAGLVDASAGARQLQEQLKSASGQVSALQPRLELARLRVRQNRELVATGAGDHFALEQAEANVTELEGQIATAVGQRGAGRRRSCRGRSTASRRRSRRRGRSSRPRRRRSTMSRADLANAQWNLDQTAVYAPTSGYAINVQLRPGSYVVAMPVAPAMSFVEEEYQVIALYAQNELPLVEPGNPAEFTLTDYPGRVIKANGRLDRLGAGPGPGAAVGHAAADRRLPAGAGPVSRQARRRRARPRAVPPRRSGGRRRDLHRARARDPHPADGDPAHRLDHRLPRAEAALMRAARHRPQNPRGGRSRPPWRAARSTLRRRRTSCRSRRCRTRTCRPRGRRAAASPAPVADRWLATFDDPALSALVAEALAYNADLQVAAARVEQAAGYVKVASGVAACRRWASPRMGGGKSGGSGGLDGVWLNASLELDIWGRLRYGQAAAEEQSAAVAADYAYARQSLAATVAKSWFLAIEAGLQRAIAQEALRSSESLLRVAQDRLRVGNGNEQAVAEARVNVGTYPRPVAPDRAGARAGAARAGTPRSGAIRPRRSPSRSASRRCRRRCRSACRRNCSSAGPT